MKYIALYYCPKEVTIIPVKASNIYTLAKLEADKYPLSTVIQYKSPTNFATLVYYWLDYIGINKETAKHIRDVTYTAMINAEKQGMPL